MALFKTRKSMRWPEIAEHLWEKMFLYYFHKLPLLINLVNQELDTHFPNFIL